MSKPAEAGLAVYRHGALGVLADLQELLEDLVGGGRPVGEEQLLVVETVALETLGIVDFPANGVRKLVIKFSNGKSSMKLQGTTADTNCYLFLFIGY